MSALQYGLKAMKALDNTTNGLQMCSQIQFLFLNTLSKTQWISNSYHSLLFIFVKCLTTFNKNQSKMESLITPNTHYFFFLFIRNSKEHTACLLLGYLKTQLQNSTLITSLHIYKLRHCTERQIEGYFTEESACTLKKCQDHEKTKTFLKG